MQRNVRRLRISLKYERQQLTQIYTTYICENCGGLQRLEGSCLRGMRLCSLFTKCVFTDTILFFYDNSSLKSVVKHFLAQELLWNALAILVSLPGCSGKKNVFRSLEQFVKIQNALSIWTIWFRIPGLVDLLKPEHVLINWHCTQQRNMQPRAIKSCFISRHFSVRQYSWISIAKEDLPERSCFNKHTMFIPVVCDRCYLRVKNTGITLAENYLCSFKEDANAGQLVIRWPSF